MRFALRSLSALGIIFGAVAHVTPAQADGVPKTYAEQTLLADGASVALVLSGIVASSFPGANVALSGAGIGGYALATPIVHAAHGEWGSAGISLGIRVVGVPVGGLIGGLAGVSACPEHEQATLESLGCFIYGGLAGVGVSAVLVSVLDAVFLAQETTREPAPPRDASRASFHLTPSIEATRRGATIGIAAVF